MTAVLITHRHRIGAELLAAAIARDPELECVGATTSIDDALTVMSVAAVDVLVLDLDLCTVGIADLQDVAGAQVVGVAAEVTLDSLGAALRAGAVRLVHGESELGELLEVLRDLP